MALRNLERERAEFVMDVVEKATSGLGNDAKYFRSYVEKMPSLVLNSGLMAAMSFVKAKGNCKPDRSDDSNKKKAYRLIYDNLNDWLRNEVALLRSHQNDFLHALIMTDSHTCRILTRETLVLMGWMKRLAKADIKETAEDE